MGCSDERHARPDGLPTFPPGPEEYDEWKRVLAVRPDLDPACPGADGKRGLNPLFVEWLMGFPLGWTAIPGATRAKRLSALGNAMVPKVAEVAFQRVTECAECADPTCGGRS
jgi:site-specific DNA-cytosine methylase